MKKIICSLMVVLVMAVSSSMAFAHSGRTTTNNAIGIPGHVESTTGVWHSHFNI